MAYAAQKPVSQCADWLASKFFELQTQVHMNTASRERQQAHTTVMTASWETEVGESSFKASLVSRPCLLKNKNQNQMW